MFTSDRELESCIKGHENKYSTRPCVGITLLHSTYTPVARRLPRTHGAHVKLNWKKKFWIRARLKIEIYSGSREYLILI